MYYCYALVEGQTVRYVGYSARLEHRRKKHNQKYPNCRIIILGAYATSEIGLEKERYWIKRLFNLGHPLKNIAGGGQPGGPLGGTRSYLTRFRMSEARKGKTSPNKGKSHSLETRAKMSEAQKGRQISPAHRAKLSEATNRFWNDPEYRAKVSKAHQGKTLSDETRVKISKAGKKRYEDPTEREKTSAAGKRWWAVHRRKSLELQHKSTGKEAK